MDLMKIQKNLTIAEKTRKPETVIDTQAVKTRPIAGQTSNLFYFPFPFPSTTLLYPTLSLVIK